MVSIESPSQSTDALVGFQDGSGCYGSPTDDVLRLKEFELSLEKRAAVFNLNVRRSAVVGRAAFECVHDVNLIPIQPCGDENLVEQLTGWSDERFAFAVLFGTRSFTEHNEAGGMWADTKHRLLSSADEIRAEPAGSGFVCQDSQGFASFLRVAV